jgi:phospholipid-binding lipoprotein MlaA
VKPARRLLAPAALLCALALGGCATTGGTPSPGDPWEGFNRKVFAFNEAVDGAVLRPVAESYRDHVPKPIRTGVANVLGNVGDLWSAANHFLQGKAGSGLEMGMRFLTNTLFGLGGLLDPASEMGLKRQSEDFGQTLGKWGVGPGPYLVLPLLGPSSLRDGIGRIPDMAASPYNLLDDSKAGLAVTVVGVVDARAALLGVTSLADQVSLDKYSFFRQAYLSRRQDAVYDGEAPPEAFEDIGDDPPPPAAKLAKPAASAPARPASAPKASPR